MCDIYSHQCNHPGCLVEIYMHLEDFSTERNEIEVYCSSHIPSDKSDGVYWEYYDDEDERDGTMFVRCLTENARSNWEGNYYNGDCEAVMVFGKKARKKNVANTEMEIR